MKRIIRLASAAFAAVSVAVAQPSDGLDRVRLDLASVTPIRLGLAAGLTGNVHSAGFVKLPGTPNCCPEFESGWGLGPYIAVVGELNLTQRFRLSMRAGYIRHDAELVREEPIAIEGDDGPIATTIKHSIDGRLASISAEARGELLPTRAFMLSLGLRLGAMVQSEFSQIERMNEEVASGTFENGRRTRNEYSGEIPNGARPTVALLFGAGYDLRLDRNGYLRATPEITYGRALTSVTDSVDWNPHTLQLGVVVSYDFALYHRDTPFVKPDPRLFAEVHFERLSDDSTGSLSIRATEVVDIRHSPIVPAIFFDSASASLPSRYRELSPSKTPQYAPDVFEGFDFDEQHRDVLNIIGSRMRSHPDASITLVPSLSGDEPQSIAAERTEAVRRYLVDVWGIESSRIMADAAGDPLRRASEKFADGRAENRHIGISSSDESILAPVPSQRVQWQFQPERLTVVPSITADAGVDHAVLDINMAGVSLKRFEYAGDEWASAGGIDWTIAARDLDAGRLPSELTARLSVVDRNGTSVEAVTDSSLSVVAGRTVHRGRFEVLGRRKRITYQLVALPLGSPDLDPANNLLMKELAEQVKPGATIMIRGYSDRLGNPQYNLALSQKRAQIADNALRGLLPPDVLPTVQIEARGSGIDTSRFDNELPEGRVLTRGVAVVVEQDE